MPPHLDKCQLKMVETAIMLCFVHINRIRCNTTTNSNVCPDFRREKLHMLVCLQISTLHFLQVMRAYGVSKDATRLLQSRWWIGVLARHKNGFNKSFGMAAKASWPESPKLTWTCSEVLCKKRHNSNTDNKADKSSTTSRGWNSWRMNARTRLKMILKALAGLTTERIFWWAGTKFSVLIVKNCCKLYFLSHGACWSSGRQLAS
jgi:hypothetical protein